MQGSFFCPIRPEGDRRVRDAKLVLSGTGGSRQA